MSDMKFTKNYTMLCRTCLQSNVEMIALSAPISENIEENQKITYMECLKIFIQIGERIDDEMPQKICLDCASALQVAYWFRKNASQSQELLRLKLIEIRRKKVHAKQENHDDLKDIKKPKRYRCKICNVKVETKRSLKDHVKLHLDIIVYNCQMCSFESHNKNCLSDHYAQNHKVEATKEQLKPKTKLTTSFLSPSKSSNYVNIDALKNEFFQILPEDSENISYQTFTKPTENLQAPAIITSNHSYTTISEPFNVLKDEINHDPNQSEEFIVMLDGSLEKVINKDVVIEYIDSGNNSNLTMANGSILDNIVHAQNIDNIVMLQQENVAQMDIDDLIIEDSSDVIDETQGNIILPLEEDTIPASFIEQPKKIMCKICTKDFLTQEQLKNHMLTHNEIPHFFCDQCKFYTFFKIDLHQHYKSKHNLQPTNKQLQPRNKQKSIDEFYECNLCFYEAHEKFDLKKHYKMKHNIEANALQLKPIKGEKLNAKLSPLSAKAKAAAIVNKTTTKCANMRFNEDLVPDYPNGLNCRKCNELFYFRKQLYEHYKMHNAEEAALKKEQGAVPSQIANVAQDPLEIGSVALSISTPHTATLNPVAPLTPSSSSTYTLPLDAVPQVVETDQTIENVDFDFNCGDGALFEDFEDEVDVENDSDENDSEFRNVLLTSDDDFEDMLQDKNDNTDISGSYCAHCQKSFLSQYQFENHMFIHRGLAPYRCEMCTNLYNTKRCLIRHYKAVHKIVPTRDMTQAKGDKVFDDQISSENLAMEAVATSLMCAKCPYESAQVNDIKFHLQSNHNINDESYITKKLPFECPRCIRSFATKTKLLTHLERSHSSTPINQYQVRFDTADNAALVAATTSVTTTINNSVIMMKAEDTERNTSCGYTDTFLKQEKEQQCAWPDAVAAVNGMTPCDEVSSSTTHLIRNENSTIESNTVSNMHSNSNTMETAPFSPTALDRNSINQPLFKCKHCLLTCYNLATFNEHSKRIECRNVNMKSGDTMLFECEICHCNYKTMYLLKHHLKRHIGRKFLCTDCPKTFINKVELEAHKNAHSGERPHKCDLCTKSFRYVHHLKRHKDSSHFGKRHACNEPDCGRKFTTMAQLKVHVWTHYGIVPYRCPFCSRLFKKRLLLREHCLKIHSVSLTEEEMANIFRNSLGYTNPHDFTVAIGNGKMLRRGDLETMGTSSVIKYSFN